MEMISYFWDFVLHIDVHLFELVEQYGLWIYAILFIIVFCETGLVVTPFLPGDSLLFASGVVAGAGLMGYAEVMLILLARGHSGRRRELRHRPPCGTGHLCPGKSLHQKGISAQGPSVLRTARRQGHRAGPFHSHSAYLCALCGGHSAHAPTTFFFFNVSGCVLWVGVLVSAGYFLGNLAWVRENFSLIVYAIIIISVLPVFIELIRARWGRSKNSARSGPDAG